MAATLGSEFSDSFLGKAFLQRAAATRAGKDLVKALIRDAFIMPLPALVFP